MAAFDPIEHITSSKKKKDTYQQYQDYQEYLTEAESLELEDLLLKVFVNDLKHQDGRRYAHLNSRALLHNELNETSQKKAELYKEKNTLYMNTAGMVFSIASISFGQGLNAVGQAFSSSSAYFDKVSRSSEEMLSHNYQHMRELASDHSSQKQSAERDHDQVARSIDQIIQNIGRKTEIMAS